MFSDTHCHLTTMKEKGIDIPALIAELSGKGCPFLLDAGTDSGDLAGRVGLWPSIADVPPFVRFSAGIWPSREAIRDSAGQVAELEKSIAAFAGKEPVIMMPSVPLVCAVGECGLDHYHNAADESAFGTRSLWAAEAELFEAQLDLARRLSLPVIVHSRDAFEGTLSCIKNCGTGRGVIHCYSYGKDEARAFLDLGWHISFAGSVTYSKRKKASAPNGFAARASGSSGDSQKIDDETLALVRYVPRDRLLIETDAPYLAPVPMRGKTNSPLFIPYTYEFVAGIIGVTPDELALIVHANALELFSRK